MNYNTFALGRQGYMSMNMIADQNAIEGLKPVARTLLEALEFDAEIAMPILIAARIKSPNTVWRR
ncbi:MAG: DUF2167 domain-containing protein [Gammaproteobacteria bacterium]